MEILRSLPFEDEWLDLSAGLKFALADNLIAQPRVTYSRNWSNIALYDYERWTAAATLRLEFWPETRPVPHSHSNIRKSFTAFMVSAPVFGLASSGVTQLRLDDGTMVSIVGAAQYRIGAAGVFELISGDITVVTPPGSSASVRMADGAYAALRAGSSASQTCADRQL